MWFSPLCSTARRWSRPRALSLAELIVAMGIFLGLIVAMVGLEQSFRAASRKSEAHADARGALLLALEYVKQELRGARVANTEMYSLDYRVPSLDSQGQVQVNSAGELLFSPSEPLNLSMDAQGRLVRTGPNGQKRVLATLGTEGWIRFFTVPGKPDLLQVQLRSVRRDIANPTDFTRTSEAQAELTLFLPNQF